MQQQKKGKNKLVKVNSSAITQITYRPKTRVMYVHMTDGTHIAYESVPQEVYEAFISAGSIGKYFNANVRNNYSFRYT